jgi:hypothetical protein
MVFPAALGVDVKKDSRGQGVEDSSGMLQIGFNEVKDSRGMLKSPPAPL